MLACYNATMQLIPAIDLLGDDAVRLERGNYERVLFRQPIEAFLSRIVATDPKLIHVVDLDGARYGHLRSDVIARCVAVANGIALQVSGGIRSVASAQRALNQGAHRVLVGTAAWAEPESLDEFAVALGAQLAVALDVRDGRLAVQGWLDDGGVEIDDALARCVAAGVVRLHVTAIDRDGTLGGPDLDLYRRACASGLAVVAAGGVRGDEDLAQLEAIGCEGAVMGLGYLERLGLTLDGEARS